MAIGKLNFDDTRRIGRVTLRNAAKNLQFVLTNEVLTLAWASLRELISIPGGNLIQYRETVERVPEEKFLDKFRLIETPRRSFPWA